MDSRKHGQFHAVLSFSRSEIKTTFTINNKEGLYCVTVKPGKIS